MSSEIFDIF